MIPTHATKNRVRYRYYTAGFDADLTAIVRRVKPDVWQSGDLTHGFYLQK